MIPLFDAPALMTFCENALATFPLHPADTVSNLGPFLAGVYVWWHASTHGRPALVSIGQAAVILGCASAIFHGTGSRFGELLDFSAMVLWICVLMWHSAGRIAAPARLLRWSAIGYGAVTVAVGVMLPTFGITAFTLLALGLVVVELSVMRQRRISFAGSQDLQWTLIVMVLAMTAWSLDYHRIVCNPDNHIMSLHSLWHWLNGIPVVLMYRHFAKPVSLDGGRPSTFVGQN